MITTTSEPIISTVLEYKGYKGTVEIDWDDKVLHGKVLDVGEKIIVYGGSNFDELIQNFHEMIDMLIEDSH